MGRYDDYVHGPDLPLTVPHVLKLARENCCDVATPDDYLATVERSYTFTDANAGPSQRLRGKCVLVTGHAPDTGEYFTRWYRADECSLDVNTYRLKQEQEAREKQRGYVY